MLEVFNTGVYAGLFQMEYITMIKEITFTNDFSGMPEECTEENLCFDISYEENQKYPVYAYLVETDEQGTGLDSEDNEFNGNLYEMYIVCSKTVFAPIDNMFLFGVYMNLENINFNNWFNTSLVTNMDKMFYYCSSLTNLNLNSFDTSSVTNMNEMFWACSSLTSLNLNSFDTSSVTNMSEMFAGCSSLTNLNINSFDTSSVTDMSGMFWICSSLTNLNLSSFDTSSVTNMNGMFADCLSLTNLDLSSFDTSSVTEMGSMFSGCSSLTTTITISGNVSSYIYMFDHAATNEGAKITVNYTSSRSDLVDNMIATKSSNSNVVKGSLVS